MLGYRVFAEPSTWTIALTLAGASASCAASKLALTEPQAPQPFASVVVECPPVLLEKDSGETGVFTATFELRLVFANGAGQSFAIGDACSRSSRALHLPPGGGKLEASYHERVKQKNSVLETPVSCELPTLGQEWAAGKTYRYRVSVDKRDARGRFYACNVTLTEADVTGGAPAPPAPSTSSALPP